MPKIGILFLAPALMTLAWAGQGGAENAKAQNCKATTQTESHPCTAAEEAKLTAIQRRVREAYGPHVSGQPYTVEEQRRALLRLLLGPEAAMPAVPHSENTAKTPAEILKRLLEAKPPAGVEEPKPPKQ